MTPPVLDADLPPWVSVVLWLAATAVTIWLSTRGLRRDVREAAQSSDIAAQHAATAAAQVTPNHGSSMNDRLAEVERELREGQQLIRADVADLKGDVGGVKGDIGGLRSELRTERTERIQLGERVDDHIRTTSHS